MDEDLDGLIERLQIRLADPARRVDVQPRAFDQAVATLDLGSLLQAGRGLGASLRSVVDANTSGRPIGAAESALVDRLAESMREPAPPALRAPADAPMLDAAEASLGQALPTSVRRVYGEVADGGFGPGSGLLPIAEAVATYHRYRVDPPMAPSGQAWPEGLLPLLAYDLGVDAVELDGGRMIGWDPESLTERSGAPGWARTFRPIADSFAAWLGDWAAAPTEGERQAAHLQASMVEQARASRAAIAAMTPKQRAAMGLPEEGWERVVWGGLGLDPDD
jgi:hypothetical protein